MTGMSPSQRARIGQRYLEEAVLDVLLEAWREGDECIGAAEISRRAGIYRERGVVDIMNDAITTGLLVKLHSENRVERCTQSHANRGGWQLIYNEFISRRDDAR